MSMDHKAFLFDTKKFHAEIEPVMKDSIRNTEVAHRYICGHLEELLSPYTGEPLEECWEEEFDELTLQVYFDILLTACYDVEEDCGLGEMWDAVNEVIKSLDVFEEGEVPVLGRKVEIDDVTVDPGMEGLGIVESNEVADMLTTRKMPNRMTCCMKQNRMSGWKPMTLFAISMKRPSSRKKEFFSLSDNKIPG